MEKADFQPGPGHYDTQSGLKPGKEGVTIGSKIEKGQLGYDISNPGPGAYDTFAERSKSGAKIGKAQRGKSEK